MSEMKAVRQAMVDGGLSRGVVNQRMGRIKRIWKWAAEEGLVKAEAAAVVALLRPLQRNRSQARETEKVRAIDRSVVEATLPYLPLPVRLMVQVQMLTGMRPEEVREMRPRDLDRRGEIWVYDLTDRHKMAYKTREKRIYIGARGQAAINCIARWDQPDLPVFRPADATTRQTNRRYRQGYGKESYCQAIRRGTEAARRDGKVVEDWTPNQLRHLYATEVRREYGLEGAQVGLGHDRADVTQVYAERDDRLARRIAKEKG